MTLGDRNVSEGVAFRQRGSSLLRPFILFSANRLLADNNIHDVWPVTTPAVRDVWTTTSTLSIVSSDAADSATGTGVQAIFLVGVDIEGQEIDENVTMNGLTPVVTTKSFYKVNTVDIVSHGTFGTTTSGGSGPTGNITLTRVSGGQLVGRLANAAANQTLLAGTSNSRLMNSHFTIPRKMRDGATVEMAYLRDMDVIVDAGQTADVVLYMRNVDPDAFAPPSYPPQIQLGGFPAGDGSVSINFEQVPLPVPPFYEIWLAAKRGGSNTKVNVVLNMLFKVGTS